MKYREWHQVPLVETFFSSLGVTGLAPDLSGIAGATGKWVSAGDDGETMLILVEVDDGEGA